MGRTTTWRHDVQGRAKCKEYADGSQITYLYENSTSRLRQRIDEKRQVTQYTYNRDDALSSKIYTNAAIATPAVAFAYDVNYPRLSSMTDGGGTTLYRYIPITPTPTLGAGQLASVDGPLPDDTITYGYDELGRRKSTAINAVASTLTFDASGRVKQASNALGTFDYTYDGNSFRVASQSYPNGQRAEFTYYNNSKDFLLKRITNTLGAALISEFLYDQDAPQGRIASWSQQSGTPTAAIYSFGYDPVDQLTSATVSQGTGVQSTFNYTYDPAGNRLSEQIDATTSHCSYNALNELTSSDATGGDAATYEWDAEHRLTSLGSGNRSTQFTYDGVGRCVAVRKLVNGSEVSNRRFVWRDHEICEERTPSGALSKRFFAQGIKIENGPAAGICFYTRDHLGSIRELTDSGGNVRARYGYDPFGRRARLEGDLEADFGFARMLLPAEVSFYLTWFRMYDPALGRWLSRDP